jgi:hypothetical protein
MSGTNDVRICGTCLHSYGPDGRDLGISVSSQPSQRPWRLWVGCDRCNTETTSNHERPRVEQSLASSVPDSTPLVEVCELWVLFRESLGSFERNSISSYFDKFRDIISLLQVLVGFLLNFAAPILRVMLPVECTFLLFYALSRLLHIPFRLVKEVVRADGLWWTGWSCRAYKCILRLCDVNL